MPGFKATILIADDEDTAREYAVLILKQSGYIVIEASSGTELVSKAKEHHPNLIITDILMPGISGYKAIENLRTDKKFAQTPVIFFSGMMKDKETFKTLKPSGPCDFLPKPFEQQELLAKIESFLMP